MEGGFTAALNVSKTSEFGFNAGSFLNGLCELFCIAYKTFGNDNNKGTLAVCLLRDDLLDRCFFIEGNFCDRNGRSAACDTCTERDMTCPTTHDLNDVAACVRFTGVAEVVDHVHRGVHRGVKADGNVCGGNVVIDGAGDTDGGDTVCGKVCCAAERTVAADGDDTVDMVVLAGLERLCHTFGILKFIATCGIEDRTALIDDIAEISCGCEKLHIAIDKTLIAFEDTVNLDATGKSFSCCRADCGVHTGRVAAGCKNTDSSELCHCFILPFVYFLGLL